ncbi:MAG: hydroxymethylbilane synthase [Verrucomicrobia bacterium]|nr:hydroxymethylbilane synthase [Verrucomicrobiota bacterium]
MSVVLGTRGSSLALAQTLLVKQALERVPSSGKIETKVIRTTGDQRLDISLSQPASPQGLFTKELEQALLEGEIDVAVHSLKDLPTSLPEGLELAAVLARHDPVDILISKKPFALGSLPGGAILATSSPRRSRQITFLRPDLKVIEVRGNVTTRIDRLCREPGWHGLVLAKAGIERLGLSKGPGAFDYKNELLFVSELTEILPAVGQGAIGLEIAAKNFSVRAMLEGVNDQPTWYCVQVEREVLRLLGGGCQLPLGVRTRLRGSTLHLEAIVFDEAGRPRSGMVSGVFKSVQGAVTALLDQIYGNGR